jgi:hypothetical protein
MEERKGKDTIIIVVITTDRTIGVEILRESDIDQEIGVMGTNKAGGTNREMGVATSPDNEVVIAIGIQ